MPGRDFAVEEMSPDSTTAGYGESLEPPYVDNKTGLAALLLDAGLGEADLWEALAYDGRVVVMTQEEYADWKSMQGRAGDAGNHRGLRLKLADLSRTLKHLELRFGCDMDPAVAQQRRIEQIHLAGETKKFRGAQDEVRHLTRQLGDIEDRLQRVLKMAAAGRTPYCRHIMDLETSPDFSPDDVAKGKSVMSYMASTWSSLSTSGSRPTSGIMAEQAYLSMAETFKRGIGFPHSGDDLFQRWLQYTQTAAFSRGQEDLLRGLQLEAERLRARNCCPGHAYMPGTLPVLFQGGAGEEDQLQASGGESSILSPMPNQQGKAIPEYFDASRPVPSAQEAPDVRRSEYGIIEHASYPYAPDHALEQRPAHRADSCQQHHERGRAASEKAPDARKNTHAPPPSKSTSKHSTLSRSPPKSGRAGPSGAGSRTGASQKVASSINPKEPSGSIHGTIKKRRSPSVESSRGPELGGGSKRGRGRSKPTLAPISTTRTALPPISSTRTALPPLPSPARDTDTKTSGLKRSNAIRRGASKSESKPKASSSGGDKDSTRGRGLFRRN